MFSSWMIFLSWGNYSQLFNLTEYYLYIYTYIYIYMCVCVCVCVFKWWAAVVLQRKTTTLMHKNIICFFSSFFFTQNVRMCRVRCVEDGWAAHRGAGVRIFSEPLFFFPLSGRNLPGYTSWIPTQTLVFIPPPTRLLHAIRGHSSSKHAIHANSPADGVPSRNFTRKHQRPVYFR